VRPVEQVSYAGYRKRVIGMSLEGAPMADIERMLGPSPLPSEHRDALWLLGWCLNEQRDRPNPQPLNVGWAS
jgi:hypothetical protein